MLLLIIAKLSVAAFHGTDNETNDLQHFEQIHGSDPTVSVLASVLPTRVYSGSAVPRVTQISIIGKKENRKKTGYENRQLSPESPAHSYQPIPIHSQTPAMTETLLPSYSTDAIDPTPTVYVAPSNAYPVVPTNAAPKAKPPLYSTHPDPSKSPLYSSHPGASKSPLYSSNAGRPASQASLAPGNSQLAQVPNELTIANRNSESSGLQNLGDSSASANLNPEVEPRKMTIFGFDPATVVFAACGVVLVVIGLIVAYKVSQSKKTQLRPPFNPKVLEIHEPLEPKRFSQTLLKRFSDSSITTTSSSSITSIDQVFIGTPSFVPQPSNAYILNMVNEAPDSFVAQPSNAYIQNMVNEAPLPEVPNK